MNSKWFGRLTEVVIFTSIYFVLFMSLETCDKECFLIHADVDAYIPFISAFVIPYLYWFFYLIAGIIFFIFWGNDEEYYRFSRCLAFGATIFIIISFLFPNYIMLRPELSYSGESILARLVGMIYESDTPSNVFPSMHVFCSIACFVAVKNSKVLSKYLVVRVLNLASVVLICLSTVFIKQHSVIDVLGAFVMYFIMYVLLYYRRSAKEKLFNDERLVN